MGWQEARSFSASAGATHAGCDDALSIKLGARILGVGLVALLLALLVWKMAHESGAKAAPGKQAPDFTLRRIDKPGVLALASLTV